MLSLVRFHSMTYREALKIILKSPLVTILISSAQFSAWMLPRKVVKVSEAIGNFNAYTTEVVEEERRSIANGEGDSIISSVCLFGRRRCRKTMRREGTA